MYRTQFASIRVPDVDDTNMPQALIDAGTDIQYATERNAARLDEVKRRRGAFVEGGSQALPNSTLVAAIWTDVIYDTGTYVNLGTFPTRVTVPRGLHLVTASMIMNGGANLNTAYLEIASPTYGILVNTQVGPINSSAATLTIQGPIYSVAGEYVTVSCFQISGAVGSISLSSCKVAKIGTL